MLIKLADFVATALIIVTGPLLRIIGKWPGNYPMFQRQADRIGVQVRSTHYYHPTYADADLPADVTQPRSLPGLDLHEDRQLALLASFNFQEELATLGTSGSPLGFSYDNDQYGYGDADSLYAMIRHYKPQRLFEIGSGNSSRVANQAIARNKAEDAAYACRHVCVEPYEMPWLEQLGPQIIRQRVQDVDLTLFDELQAGDILFVDSSHVIRPFGDVLVEFQQIIPRLAPGVIVHVHDIFTPRDYPEKWLRNDRLLWNEQYLMEVLLTNSARYRTVLAMNWMHYRHREAVCRAFPNLVAQPSAEPGAYWFEVL
ncbi:MAG: class I SAM-dependent methyltransferase [Porphyrobacter sp.]|nr:class I SAM-dependent methyltransferase [Porphyrobacter sp.]